MKSLQMFKINLIKNIAYLSLVRPILKYSSSVRDPYTATNVLSIEKIQKELPNG